MRSDLGLDYIVFTLSSDTSLVATRWQKIIDHLKSELATHVNSIIGGQDCLNLASNEPRVRF